MADISKELAAIMAAVFGRDVRQSIHDAIDKVNKTSEVCISAGTDITSPSSSSTGFYERSLYININTWQMWKCTGVDTWQLLGSFKGDDGKGIDEITGPTTVGLVDTYTIVYTDGTTDTFEVHNGADGTDGMNGSKWYKGTALTGTGTGITGFPGNKDDFYLNSTDGYVYQCVQSGGASNPGAALWDYVMTLSGGGGGSSVTVVDNLNSTSPTDALSANQGRNLNEKKIEKPASASAGQILGFDGTNWGAVNAPSGGGMLPYLYIDSEAGSTVTVTQPDGTTITPTAAGSGHWECELTGGYGTYVIHSVLSGQGDATLSLAVDTVKEYHVTDTHYDFTINVTAPSGSSVRITGGGETYTGTGSSQAFAVHTPSTTYTVAVTMDGNTKSETITSAATSGQSGSVTIAFGTINLTYANDFRGKTITCTKSGVTVTKTAPSGGNTMTFRVPTTGTWTISGTIGTKTYTVDATVSSLSTAVSVSLKTKALMYSFETCTDQQLADMLESYYNGEYDAADIATLKSTYMPIGAKRSISLSAMAATGVSESHHADSYQFTIIGHEHDDLKTASSGGKTKAFLTLQLDRILYKNTTDATYSSSYPAVADEGGYMNSTNTNVGGWTNCARRSWCNDVFLNALPAAIKSLVKTVNKLTSAGNQSANIDTTEDDVFLLSEIEVFGTVTNSKAGEGSQYEYYQTASNINKKPSYTSYASAYWWERSPYRSGALSFCGVNGCGVNGNGASSGLNASNAFGVAPAFCI